MQVWFKGDGITAANDGDKLDTWPDSSGNSKDAVQHTDANRPVYHSAALNGWPVVRFDGTQLQYMSSTASPATGATGRTVLAVITNASQTVGEFGYNHVVHWGGLVKDSAYGLVTRCNSTETGNTGNINMGNHYWYDGLAGNVLVNASTMLIETNYDGVSTDTFLLDGMVAGQKVISLTTGGGPVVIGSRNDHTTEFYTGDIAELLIFSPNLSDADRYVVENYLAYKYQIY
jgi:hypothetical protein